MKKWKCWLTFAWGAAQACALILLAGQAFAGALPVVAQESPHGLEPAADMPYIPDLGGLRVQSFKNQYGQIRHLSEGVVLRQSKVLGDKAVVPAGGLFYISETLEDAAPFFRDPFLLLGEHAYLVDLVVRRQTLSNIKLNRGDKKLVDERGYRLWFDYATDHYDKPYIQLALISPAGHWPLEFPVSAKFPTIAKDLVNLQIGEGHGPQIDDFYLDPNYEYGMSRFVVKDHDFDQAEFASLSYPVIDQATFSLHRPWIRDLRQEDFRWYGTKRIYAFRRAEGFLVRVTNWSGRVVLGEQLIRPLTPQGYKDREDQKDLYSFTLPEHDMRIEITLHPDFMKQSDFVPWSVDAPYGWTDGCLNLVVYDNLVTVRNGEAWPLDNRYLVGLEANLLTGKLQRLILENAEPFTLDNAHSNYKGPEKYSAIWNRPFFTVVARNFSADAVHNYYLRDRFFMRTDNLAFDAYRGRTDIDFFIGRAPTFIPILESSFLTRLANTTYGVVVEPSHFTSYPCVIDNMAFHSPDATAPFGGLQRGFGREQVTNRRKDRLTSAEGLVIRGSYVDWRAGRIVIPPAGLFYTSRNARNVRALHGESFYVLGRRAYLATFESTTFVRKNFDLDFWRAQPSGDMNYIFWQDEPLGVNNKVLRFSRRGWLDDRPLGIVNVVKYSGNNFGAPFLLAQNFKPEAPQARYYLNRMFAEGATWIIPEFVGENYMRVQEFGTPAIASIQYTYTEPVRVLLGIDESCELGRYRLTVEDIQPEVGTVTIAVADLDGNIVGREILGPLNAETRAFLPQHQKIVNTLQLVFGLQESQAMAEMDVLHPFEDGLAGLWLYVDLEKLIADTPLPTDPRFMVRPDVCGHCYQLNELLFDNAEEIVLDRNHPRYDGPKNAEGQPMFSIVIDSFDGEMIHAWHIETVYRGRTFNSQNLAFNPRNNVDVLMGVNGTIEGFLRASMLERSAYQEYWRTGQRLHPLRGVDFRMTHKFQ